MALVYSVLWQTPGRVLVSAVGTGRGRCLLLRRKRRGIERAMLGTAGVSVGPLDCTGPFPGRLWVLDAL